jgi:hypothetical protein
MLKLQLNAMVVVMAVILSRPSSFGARTSHLSRSSPVVPVVGSLSSRRCFGVGHVVTRCLNVKGTWLEKETRRMNKKTYNVLWWSSWPSSCPSSLVLGHPNCPGCPPSSPSLVPCLRMGVLGWCTSLQDV